MNAFNLVKVGEEHHLKLKPDFLKNRGKLIQLTFPIKEYSWVKENQPILSLESSRGLIVVNSPLQGLVHSFSDSAAEFPECVCSEDAVLVLKEMTIEEFSATAAERALSRPEPRVRSFVFNTAGRAQQAAMNVGVLGRAEIHLNPNGMFQIDLQGEDADAMEREMERAAAAVVPRRFQFPPVAPARMPEDVIGLDPLEVARDLGMPELPRVVPVGDWMRQAAIEQAAAAGGWNNVAGANPDRAGEPVFAAAVRRADGMERVQRAVDAMNNAEQVQHMEDFEGQPIEFDVADREQIVDAVNRPAQAPGIVLQRPAAPRAAPRVPRGQRRR